MELRVVQRGLNRAIGAVRTAARLAIVYEPIKQFGRRLKIRIRSSQYTRCDMKLVVVESSSSVILIQHYVRLCNERKTVAKPNSLTLSYNLLQQLFKSSHVFYYQRCQQVMKSEPFKGQVKSSLKFDLTCIYSFQFRFLASGRLALSSAFGLL